MCRLLGVVSSETTDYRFSLHQAPSSLAALSPDHPDGWGLAVHAAERGWTLHKDATAAHADPRFHREAAAERGEILVAHVRKRTVGPIGIANTHPFSRGRWVFAHNGTIRELDWLAARTSAARRAEVEGDTDSERFFAYLLSAIDAGDARGESPDDALWHAAREARSVPGFGPCNFLLSDGRTLWAHRSGRTLFALLRGHGDTVVPRRRSAETRATVDTPWSQRRVAVLIASERLTDEPWEELPEESLLAVEATAHPRPRPIHRSPRR